MTLAQTVDLMHLIHQRKPKLDVDAMADEARATARDGTTSTPVELLRLAWSKGIKIYPDDVKPAITMPEGLTHCPQHAIKSKKAPQTTLDSFLEE
jgi:hypothetical protein